MEEIKVSESNSHPFEVSSVEEVRRRVKDAEVSGDYSEEMYEEEMDRFFDTLK